MSFIDTRPEPIIKASLTPFRVGIYQFISNVVTVMLRYGIHNPNLYWKIVSVEEITCGVWKKRDQPIHECIAPHQMCKDVKSLLSGNLRYKLEIIVTVTSEGSVISEPYVLYKVTTERGWKTCNEEEADCYKALRKKINACYLVDVADTRLFLNQALFCTIRQ